MSLLPPPPLLAIVGPWQEGLAPSATTLLHRARTAIAAGLSGVLLRVPLWCDRETMTLARELRGLLPRGRGWLGLHDRPHLVRACGADGVHLGFRSLAPAEARLLVGPDVAIGYSSHAGDGPAAWEGADYLFHGPVFETPSKAGLLAPVGVRGFHAFVSSTRLPVWALGGLTPARALEVAGSSDTLAPCGFRGMAILRGIVGASDPARATTDFLGILAPLGARQ